MKKITKISKIFLVLVTIFSQLSSVVTVLADEITTKPLTLTLEQIFDEDNITDYYELTYTSENKDYEETELVEGIEVEKTYDIELTTKFTYLNETEEEKIHLIEDISGKKLNEEIGTYQIDPISKYYDGEFSLNLKVKDNASIIYEITIPYTVSNSYKGLIGSLNNGEVLPTEENINISTSGKYTVEEGKEYTQNLILMPGELSPTGTYKVVNSDETMSEEMTGEELFNEVFTGTTTDLTGKLSGEYTYQDKITIVEVSGEEVLRTYEYTYNTVIDYESTVDNDTIFNSIYENLEFNGDNVIANAKNLYETESVITIGEIKEKLASSNYNSIELEILDENGESLNLEDETVLTMEIKNNYKIKFTSGAEAIYTVIIKGDNTSDNTFDSNDMIPTMDNYLNDEKNIQMDLFTVESEDETTGEPITEEVGTITFEDIMQINELLKENGDITKVEEDNQGLSLLLSEIPDEVYVGDTFELSLIINNTEADEYIDGIEGLISTNSNLKITDIKFNSNLLGSYTEEGKFVAAGEPLSENETVVMTVTLMAIENGTGEISVEGQTAKYQNIDAFDKLITNINIIRKYSTNNNLSSLRASIGTFDIEFDKDVTVYTLTVPYDTETVILSGALEDLTATVDGLIEYELTEEKTTAIIKVVAEDGTEKVYTVYIIKESKPVTKPVTYYYSSNNYLKELEIDGYEIEFDRETNEYKIKVKSDVTSLEIKALAEDSRSRVEITGNENFKTGENTVIITVTAENGSTREYKIIVDKEETKEKVSEIKDSSNTAEKIVIIVLIILVVLGLLYLIFKKDDEEKNLEEKNTKSNNNNKNKNKNKK